MALKLKRKGIANVYPMIGGMHGWLAAGLPTEPSEAVDGDPETLVLKDGP